MRISIFNAENLKEIFEMIDKGKKTKEEIAKFYGVSSCAIGNYLLAKQAYEKGEEVNAQNVSVPAFKMWATKYGNKGEPKFKKEAPGRKHVKKAVQQQFDLPVTHVDAQEDQMEKDAEEARAEIQTESSSDVVEKESFEICGLVIEISIKTKGRG